MPDSESVGRMYSLVDGMDDEDHDDEFEELDPSGRYGRYKEVLGRGAFKTVYKAFDKMEGIEVAWNQIKVQDVLRTPDDMERLYSEVHLLKTLKHKNIIKFYHSWVDADSQNLNFLTEMFTSGTLRQYRRRHRCVGIRAIKNWSRQILRGLLYLHSHDPPIIHRDLKCDNIFINGNQGEVKIGDLGLAAIVWQACAAHSVIGTPEFMAPELYEEEYTELVDIYSFGMCLLEMITCEYPYSECSNAAQIYKRVTSGKKPAALSKVKDPCLRQFVEKCISTASRRLPARELLMDPFLQCDRDHDSAEGLQFTCGGLKGAKSDECFESLGNTLHRPSSMSRSFANLGSFPSLLGDAQQAPMLLAGGSPKCITGTEHGAAKSPSRTPPSSHPIEDKVVRKMDFQVKGKRREKDTLHLRLRIADSEGEVQIIQIRFEVESDTAMSVASEMVAKLNLADQDVTKIAELIDDAVMVMVPEWRLGVAINKGGGGSEEHLSRTPKYSDPLKVHRTSDQISTVSSESSLIGQSQHDLMALGNISEGSGLSPQTEATMLGHFEEVTRYHHHKPECLPLGGGNCPISSSASLEELNEHDMRSPLPVKDRP